MAECADCGSDRLSEVVCLDCGRPIHASWAVMLATHITEHLADGLTEPLAILSAMTARPCYRRHPLDLSLIAQQMRLLTRDTTALARDLAKARAARTMLEILETGDAKDKIAVQRGIGVLGDRLDISGQISLPVRVEHVYLSSTGGYLTLPGSR